MKNKLKEIKQYCEQQICKIQDNYPLDKLYFKNNDICWLITKQYNVCNSCILDYNYNEHIKTYVYTVIDDMDLIESGVVGDNLFINKIEAEKYSLYQLILNNTIKLLEFEK